MDAWRKERDVCACGTCVNVRDWNAREGKDGANEKRGEGMKIGWVKAMHGDEETWSRGKGWSKGEEWSQIEQIGVNVVEGESMQQVEQM